MKCWCLFWISLCQTAPLCVLWGTAGNAAAIWGVFREGASLQLSVITVFLQNRGYLLFTSSQNCSAVLLIFLNCKDKFKMGTSADPWLFPRRSWLFSVTLWKPRERQESSIYFNSLQLHSTLTLIDKVALLNISNIYHICWLSCCFCSQHRGATCSTIRHPWFMVLL